MLEKTFGEMNQVSHNPRNINAVTGAMGMYSELREARIG
jgi:hypothetical protein